MNKITKLHEGLWHIEEFLPYNIWCEVEKQIKNLPDSEYKNLHEPMRSRLEIFDPTDGFYIELMNLAVNTVKAVSEITSNYSLRNPPGLFLWRDFENYMSYWHPDDFTRSPTMQIYVDGENDQGTSFRIGNEEIKLPFKPNTGYLLDNRCQLIHGMLTPIRKKVRQSIYLIY